MLNENEYYTTRDIEYIQIVKDDVLNDYLSGIPIDEIMVSYKITHSAILTLARYWNKDHKKFRSKKVQELEAEMRENTKQAKRLFKHFSQTIPSYGIKSSNFDSWRTMAIKWINMKTNSLDIMFYNKKHINKISNIIGKEAKATHQIINNKILYTVLLKFDILTNDKIKKLIKI